MYFSNAVFGPAPINWCESDFVVPYVAEYHNTLTNIAYVIASLSLLRQWTSIPMSRSNNLLFVFFVLCLMLTGITSGWFHATLIWAAQKADEIFENWTVISLYHLGTLNRDANLSLFFAHCIVVATGIWCIPTLFCEIHLIVLSFATAWRYSQLILPPLIARSVYKAAFLAIFGFACWLLDFFFCGSFQHMHLHAYGWHILTAIALHEAGGVLLYVLRNRKDD